jgi:broad specificity phosphatase PhoE
VTTFLLARHGETDWNAERRWQGHADPPLNARGREQAGALAERLERERIDAVYSSDLRRAQETAEIVAERLGHDVQTDARLREVDVGEWSGLTIAEIEDRFPEAFERWRAYEHHGWETGESYDEMAERVVAALHDIADRHPDGCVLVVTHGGPVRAVGARCEGIAQLEYRRKVPVVENCRLSRMAVEKGAMRRID